MMTDGARHLAQLNVGRMWFVPAGHRPTLDEALERLAHLKARGDGDHAFGWAWAKEARLWQERACSAVAAE